MAQLFARIELRGTPGEAGYERLHAHMESLNWYRTIDGVTEAGDQIRMTHENRPMHVSSRDSPQSLEFWEDGRQSVCVAYPSATHR
jgi:hypothetical protein